MYSRDFGGIQSDGQLYNMEREYNNRNYYEPAEEHQPSCQAPQGPTHKSTPLGFLRDLKVDDLILIGIGLLLLLDSEEDNNIFVLLIAFLLFF